jgi:hypothetical protein
MTTALTTAKNRFAALNGLLQKLFLLVNVDPATIDFTCGQVEVDVCMTR